MKTYLVRFKPLEWYSLGAERQFHFAGRDDISTYSPYFIRTNALPEQSTIFGTLRYLILKQHGCIKSDFKYSSEEKEKISELVGSRSFSLTDGEQDFGKLKKMSPLFLLRGFEELAIPNPFNNIEKCEDNIYRDFVPMSLIDQKFKTNHGDICLPKESDYKAKEGYGQGFYHISLDEKAQRKEACIFKSRIHTGNAKSEREDSLFKREIHSLHPDYAFAVYVTVDCDLTNDFVYMGQKSSLFQVLVEEKEDDLIEVIQKHFANCTPKEMIWHYALSDIKPKANMANNRFAITEDKVVRQIRTDLNHKKTFKKIALWNEEIHLYRSGSVFYGEMDQLAEDSSQIAGYQTIIKIKGEK